MDVEANHLNGYIQVGHFQVSAPETYEALPLNDTLHGGKNSYYLVLIFSNFWHILHCNYNSFYLAKTSPTAFQAGIAIQTFQRGEPEVKDSH